MATINTDLDLANIDYSRKQALADSLRKQSQEALQGQMVGNRFVAPSWTQHLAKVLQGYQSGQVEDQAMQEFKTIRDAYKDKSASEISDFMTTMQGRPERIAPPLTVNDDEGNVNANINMPAQEPNRSGAMAMALRSQNPTLQSMGGEMMKNEMFPKLQVVGRSLLDPKGKVVGTDPTVEAERLAKVEESKRAQADKIEADTKAAAIRSEEAKVRQESDRALRRELGDNNNQLRRDILASARNTDIPKLKQGEIWNKEDQRVDAVKGSDTYIKQSGSHGKDYAALNTIDTKLDNTISTINKNK
jgi:hypothetical protein